MRASYRLSETAKLLYGLLLELDRPERNGVGGASMSYVELARQLGAGADYTCDVRTHLHQLGLVLKRDVRGVREAFWFPTLPPDLEREPPAGSLPEAKRRWVREQADLLDRLVAAVEARTTTPLTEARRRRAASRDGGERTPPSDEGRGRTHTLRGANAHPSTSHKGANQRTDGGERTPPSEHESRAPGSTSETLKTSETIVSHSPTTPECDTDRTRSKPSETGTPLNTAKLRALVNEQLASKNTPATPTTPPEAPDEELPASLSQDPDDSLF